MYAEQPRELCPKGDLLHRVPILKISKNLVIARHLQQHLQ